MQKSKTKLKKGFTLIEILITIAILGILAGIILVKLNGARERSHDKAALSTMESLSKAVGACLISKETLTNLTFWWWFPGPPTGLWFHPPTVGTPVCGDSRQVWPELKNGWSIVAVTSEATIAEGYYVIRAVNGTKNITCSFAPIGWGSPSTPHTSNRNYKCETTGL